ncbi:MAG: Mu-like prophage major head subunit gpT family protein [Pseudomonadota bacterium]
MDINAANLLALNTAYNVAFNERLTGVESTYTKIAMTVPSSTKSQGYPKLSELRGMREWVGERHKERLTVDGFEITNRKFENTVVVGADEIADDQHGIYGTFFGDMGQTTAELPDELVWEQLEKGFDTAHYDEQFFFDTDHPVEDENGVEQSVSNFGGGSGSAWYLVDDSRMIMPIIFQDREAARMTSLTNLTDANVAERDEFEWFAKRRCAAGFGAWQLIYASRQPLTAANYAAARRAMLEMRGHRGRKLNLRPRLLVVSAASEEPAREILLSERAANGSTNPWRNTAELHVETRLTL